MVYVNNTIITTKCLTFHRLLCQDGGILLCGLMPLQDVAEANNRV